VFQHSPLWLGTIHRDPAVHVGKLKSSIRRTPYSATHYICSRCPISSLQSLAWSHICGFETASLASTDIRIWMGSQRVFPRVCCGFSSQDVLSFLSVWMIHVLRLYWNTSLGRRLMWRCDMKTQERQRHEIWGHVCWF
jgi:hypothetical protein